jgi:ectoine hydroxylase-related dioxygenase (phytanoyl-CoA dioxygenase family)
MVHTDRRVELTAAEQALLPTPGDVALYRERGYHITPRIFSDAELDGLIEATDRFYAGDVDDYGVELPARMQPTPGNYAGLRKHDCAWLQSAYLNAFVRKPIISAIAAVLAGTDEVRLWHDQLLYKPVDDGADRPVVVGWHTDRGYWQTCTSEEMLTAWIPFHDCDEALGPITMIEGSNRWDESVSRLNFFDTDLDGQEREIVATGRSLRKVPMVLGKGQCSFHHCRTIHGSLPNHGERPRRALALHMQDGANRYRVHRMPDGNVAWHPNDELVRKVDGLPDYADPVTCPVLYRREWYA